MTGTRERKVPVVGLFCLQSQLFYFYEASLFVETVATSAVICHLKLLNRLFHLDRPITRRDVPLARNPRSNEMVVCCNKNTFLTHTQKKKKSV